MSKLIGEGGYGCVYYPSFSCKGQISSKVNTVSKIQRITKDIEREILIGKIITKIPYFTKYFAPIIDSCLISIKTIDKIPFIEKCDLLENTKYKKFLLSKVPRIPGLQFKYYLSDVMNPNQFCILVLNSYSYLIGSLQILLDYDICHYDIKFENILQNVIDNIPIIIDFGLSFLFSQVDSNASLSELKKSFYIYAPEYYIWSPEIHIICYCLENLKDKQVLQKQKLKEILTEIVDNMDIWYFFSDEFKSEFLSALYSNYKKLINKEIHDIISYLLQFKYTWDSYSLSISFIKLINKRFFSENFSEIFSIFNQILLIQISPNPNNRLSLSKLKNLLNEIFNFHFTQQFNNKYIDYSLSDSSYKIVLNQIIPNLNFIETN